MTIDYEKLRIAHELCAIYKPANRLKLTFIYTNNGEIYYRLSLEPASLDYECSCIEEVIEKLQSLVKPEPKYKMDQEVWINDHDSPTYFFINDITFQYSFYEYNGRYSEKLLFPTRESLIENQIEYWQSLRAEIITECKHLWNRGTCFDCGAEKECRHKPDIQSNQSQVDVDGCQHESASEACLSNPPWYKCLKCGEFYR